MLKDTIQTLLLASLVFLTLLIADRLGAFSTIGAWFQ